MIFYCIIIGNTNSPNHKRSIIAIIRGPKLQKRKALEGKNSTTFNEAVRVKGGKLSRNSILWLIYYFIINNSFQSRFMLRRIYV
ncbi:uncharacterized protein VTP21DRAFT_6993 [Calcarisporiella thermophila]|uniref:uncharacterized protein n=1 Tax=Calcarisporiella thermophila TaxID=911321 RepID=UPI0037436454